MYSYFFGCKINKKKRYIHGNKKKTNSFKHILLSFATKCAKLHELSPLQS